jgi:hypothetical protein
MLTADTPKATDGREEREGLLVNYSLKAEFKGLYYALRVELKG